MASGGAWFKSAEGKWTRFQMEPQADGSMIGRRVQLRCDACGSTSQWFDAESELDREIEDAWYDEHGYRIPHVCLYAEAAAKAAGTAEQLAMF